MGRWWRGQVGNGWGVMLSQLRVRFGGAGAQSGLPLCSLPSGKQLYTTWTCQPQLHTPQLHAPPATCTCLLLGAGGHREGPGRGAAGSSHGGAGVRTRRPRLPHLHRWGALVVQLGAPCLLPILPSGCMPSGCMLVHAHWAPSCQDWGFPWEEVCRGGGVGARLEGWGWRGECGLHPTSHEMDAKPQTLDMPEVHDPGVQAHWHP